jgi:hypothetical protein
MLGIMAMYYNGPHPGKVLGCTFIGTGTLLSPHNNYCGGYPQCGIRVHDVKKIQLGDPATYSTLGRNIYQDMLSGIYCTNSSADIYTSEFLNMHDPLGSCTTPEGCGIYASSNPGVYCKVNIGEQSVSELCIFSNCTYGVYEKTDVSGAIKGNKFAGCENAIANYRSTKANNIVQGNVIDNFKKGIYFFNAVNSLQYGLEIYENLFNTNMTSFNPLTYGKEAINVSNAISNSTNLWVRGNVINYTRTGIFARNVWEPCNIIDNTVNFDILPADALAIGDHHGIQCENDNGLEVDHNYIRWRNQPAPPSGFINKMNGISINYSTNTNTISGGIFENKIGPYPAVNTGSTYGMGSGINISSDCKGLILYCNKMNRCEEGVTFHQADLGPQGFQDHGLNWYSNGNTFVYTPGQGGIYRIAGTVINPVDWAYVNANEDPHPYQNNIIVAWATAYSSHLCAPPAPLPDDERNDLYGMLVSNDSPDMNPDYSGYEEQIKYAAQEKFYAAAKEDPAILNAGVAEDDVYEDLFQDLDNSNIGMITEIKTSIDSLEYSEAAQKLSSLVNSNLAELNKKIVMTVYLETIADGTELDSSHRMQLEPISLLHPLIGGEGVFWACAMLDKPVNNVLPPLRKANPNNNPNKPYLAGLNVFPNPARDEIKISYHAEVPLTLTITDIAGKIILNADLDTKSEIKKVNTSMIDAGTYLIKVMNVNEVVFTDKVVIIR